MLKVEGWGGPIETPPPSRLHETIFSSRLLGLIHILNHTKITYINTSSEIKKCKTTIKAENNKTNRTVALKKDKQFHCRIYTKNCKVSQNLTRKRT